MTTKLIKNKLITVISLLFIVGLSCSSFNSGKHNIDDLPSLKSSFEPYFLMGTTLNENHVLNPDEDLQNLVISQFNIVTAENKMKWENIHPLPGIYDFEASDSLVAFASRNNLKVIGHTLIWHSQTPDWVFTDEEGNWLSRDALIERMREHIFTVAGRYRGQVYGWDVVNEAVLDNGELRDSKWKQIIGDDYIKLAFQFAAEADPYARLYYNDYSLPNPEKREGVVNLITSLKQKGVRIDGIGMQAHYHFHYPDINELEKSIEAFARLGVDVMITELDLNVLPIPDDDHLGADVADNYEFDEYLNPFGYELPDSIQQMHAERYAEFFEIFLMHSDKISRVTFWGVHDGQSWLNNWPVKNRVNHPLLFDRNLQAKPAFYKVIGLTRD
jgi:endo-1,4-beta-xylanase